MHKFRLTADGKMLTGIFNLIYAQQIIGLGLTQPGAQVPSSVYPKRPLTLSFSDFVCSCKIKTKCDIMILIIYSLLSSDIGTCC